MDELCNLLEGAKLEKQHVYFRLAKEDINKLASQFYYNVKVNTYDNTKLQLPFYCKNIEYDPVQLKIVITYVKTYGLLFFKECLQNINPAELIFYESDYEEYLTEYLREFDNLV